MLTGKSDILSQKDYDRPLEIEILEQKLIMIDEDLVGPIKENYENIAKLVYIEEQPGILQADPKVNFSSSYIFNHQINSSLIGPKMPKNFSRHMIQSLP